METLLICSFFLFAAGCGYRFVLLLEWGGLLYKVIPRLWTILISMIIVPVIVFSASVLIAGFWFTAIAGTILFGFFYLIFGEKIYKLDHQIGKPWFRIHNKSPYDKFGIKKA